MKRMLPFFHITEKNYTSENERMDFRETNIEPIRMGKKKMKAKPRTTLCVLHAYIFM